MAYVIADPELMTAAATDLATIASNVNAAHMVAAAPTVAVVPAAADEVSAGIAHVFSQHAASYQGLAGQAAAFHEQFVHNLTASAGAYAAADAANASLLQPLTAIEGSFTSAIGALQGQIINFLWAAGDQLLGSLFNSELFRLFYNLAFGLTIFFWLAVIFAGVTLLVGLPRVFHSIFG